MLAFSFASCSFGEFLLLVRWFSYPACLDVFTVWTVIVINHRTVSIFRFHTEDLVSDSAVFHSSLELANSLVWIKSTRLWWKQSLRSSSCILRSAWDVVELKLNNRSASVIPFLLLLALECGRLEPHSQPRIKLPVQTSLTMLVGFVDVIRFQIPNTLLHSLKFWVNFSSEIIQFLVALHV